MVLLLKLFAIASFLGGPLVLLDWLTPQLGPTASFALMFAPCALVLFGALALDDQPGWYRRVCVGGGDLGALLLLTQNGLACYLATRPVSQIALEALNLAGIVAGSAVAVWYLIRSRRTPTPFDLERELAWLTLRAKLRDYALLAISLSFVSTGVWLFPRDHDLGISTVVFFGGCGVVPVLSIRRKRRQALVLARGELAPLALPADQTLRPQRKQTLSVLLGLLVGGLVLVRFGTGYPWFVRSLFGFVAAVGAVGALLTALGKLPVGFVRFDDTCLTLGRRGFVMHVPWDAITAVSTSEHFDNPCVLISLDDFGHVTSSPPERGDRARAELAKNDAWVGAPVLVMTTQYGVDALALALTIEARRAARAASPT